MRVTPTREQMAYLASIGVSSETIAQPRPDSPPPLEDRHSPGSGSAGWMLPWWAILLVIIVLLLSLAGLARAEEPPPVREDTATPGAPPDRRGVLAPAQRLDAIEVEIDAIKEAVGRAATGEQMTTHQREIIEIDRRLASLQETLLEETKHREDSNREIQLIQADIGDIRANLAALAKTQGHRSDEIAARVKSIAEQADARIVQARHISEKLVKTKMHALRGSLDEHREDFNEVMTWVIVIGATSMGLVITGWISMQNRMRQTEQAVISGLSETAANSSGCPSPTPEPTKPTTSTPKPANEKRADIEPTRPRPQLPPESIKQMQTIIASANKLRHIRVKPRLPSKTWELGLATHKGNVRTENQDYGLCFRTDGHDVLVVADGCGGIPHGQRAAYLAVVSAAVSVVRTYGMAPRWNTPHVKDAAAKAIMDAAHRLAVEGDKLDVTDVRGGLRTTLIVVIGNRREFGYAYIGDGGGCIVNSCGEVHRFLDPHKANNFAMNVLSASLGPMMEGEPATGVLKRSPGDILIVGTDGVFDRVDKIFPKDVVRGCIQYAGDLQKTAEHVLEELAVFQDDAGYICDDNLTLGLMGDGTAPKLLYGFWASVNEDAGATASADPPHPAVSVKEEVA